MSEKAPTSFRLSPECREYIRQIGQRLGIKDAAVIEIAVRRLAVQELVSSPIVATGSPEPAAKRRGARKRKEK